MLFVITVLSWWANEVVLLPLLDPAIATTVKDPTVVDAYRVAT